MKIIQKKVKSENMKKYIHTVKIKYEIGDIIETKIKKEKLQIIGYEVVTGRGIRYVCVDGGDERFYRYDFEIETKVKDLEIGFI